MKKIMFGNSFMLFGIELLILAELEIMPIYVFWPAVILVLAGFIIEEGIYKTKSRYSAGDEDVFVTSLTFEMEPDCYGEEDASPRNLTQVPIEGLLDEFNLFVTDFYEQLNETSETICYQEFGSFDLADIQKLRTLIGKRFYAVPYMENGEEYYNMVTE